MVKKSSLSTIVVFHTLLVFATAFLLCLPVSAYASANSPPPEPPADGTSPPPGEGHGPEEMDSYGTPVAILPTTFYAVAFFHDPSVSESAFTMRVSQFGTVAGCAQLQQGKAPRGQKHPAKGETEMKYLGDRLDVKLILPEMANRDGEPRYTNYDCETKHLEAYVDLKLDRDQLLAKNVTKFAFEAKELDLGSYDFDLNKDRMIFKSKYSEDVQETWLTLWFFPQGTIKLYVPEARSDMNVVRDIKGYGRVNGLIPLEEVLEGYTLPYTATNYAYFVDPKKVFLKDLSVEDNNKQVGHIGSLKTYYGPKGAQEEVKKLPVYAGIVREQKIWK